MNHLDKCIICPKCGTKTMRKALGKNPIAEYYDDTCHQYFTVCELVHCWNYDGTDFIADDYQIPPDNTWNAIKAELEIRNTPIAKKLFSSELSEKDYAVVEKLVMATEVQPIFLDYPVVEDKIIATTWFDTVSTQVIDEPTFKSPPERLEAYEMVDRMFIGIPEYAMEDNSVDTGA
jgi:hypothetical protein